MKRKKKNLLNIIPDFLITWIGSTSSMILHTTLFALFFLSHWLFGWSLDSILLVLTTIVSLEAIYLAIFIQRAVNQQAVRLEDVEETLDDVEESIDETQFKAESLTNNNQIEKSLEDIINEMKVLLKSFKQIQDKSQDDSLEN